MTLIIGLAGRAEHGKSAASRIINEWVRKQGGSCAIIELSQVILEHCWETGLIPNGQARDQNNLEQNKIIVDEGTRVRNLDKTHWMSRTITRCLNSYADVAVIPNIRLPYESKQVKAFDGYVWKINRVNADGTPFISKTRDPNHILETAVDSLPADFYLTNVTGHGPLLEELVVTLFEYNAALEEGHVLPRVRK